MTGQPTKAAGRMLVLGIESSCDETAAAVVAREANGGGRVLSNVIRSQLAEHRPFGGVVPEIAARAHLATLDRIIAEAMAAAGVSFTELDGIAATAGPGLVGSLLIGLTTAKAIALVHELPLLAINHLEAHALTPGLTDGLRPPYLLLLVSGGHTQILAVHDVGRYERIGTTVDDALGEAFDKVAKLLGLDYPGGPEVERLAAIGDPARFALPRPMLGRAEPHFSLTGLKTAVRRQALLIAPLTGRDVADLCAGFQAAICEVVADRVACAIGLMAARNEGSMHFDHLVVAGGVAANAALRRTLAGLALAHRIKLVVPPAVLCTDNAAMIAWTGLEKLARGGGDRLDATVRARWPLDGEAKALVGSGRLGMKV